MTDTAIDAPVFTEYDAACVDAVADYYIGDIDDIVLPNPEDFTESDPVAAEVIEPATETAGTYLVVPWYVPVMMAGVMAIILLLTHKK